jgi:hypothetical protein
MTLKIHRVQTAAGAISILEKLSRHSRFRSQRNAGWKLGITLARHFISPSSSTTPLEIDGMIDQFIVNLKSIGIDLPFETSDRRARLEFARHYGVRLGGLGRRAAVGRDDLGASAPHNRVKARSRHAEVVTVTPRSTPFVGILRSATFAKL